MGGKGAPLMELIKMCSINRIAEGIGRRPTAPYIYSRAIEYLRLGARYIDAENAIFVN